MFIAKRIENTQTPRHKMSSILMEHFNKKNQFGFSIIEVILAIGILAVIGVITSNLLTRTYRTSSDAELISKLKQNGAVASDGLSEAIRMADAVVCYGANGAINNRIIIRTLQGKYWQFRFVDPVISGGKVTQNGYIAKQENLVPLQGDLSAFCQMVPTPAQEIVITDRNIDTGVNITNGDFKKISGSVGKDTVTIKFDVNPAGNQTGAIGIANIQTTVQVR